MSETIRTLEAYAKLTIEDRARFSGITPAMRGKSEALPRCPHCNASPGADAEWCWFCHKEMK